MQRQPVVGQGSPGSCCLLNSMAVCPLQVAEEWANGTFKLNPNDEDIHTANERRLKVKSPFAHPESRGNSACLVPNSSMIVFITGRGQERGLQQE